MLNTITYHLSKKVFLPFTEAIEKVTTELKKEGFGIITFIDIRDTFKKRSMRISETMSSWEPATRNIPMKPCLLRIN